jgi:hypothetical protein
MVLAFANAPFPVPYDEVATFLRSLGHDDEIIEMLRRFEVTYVRSSRLSLQVDVLLHK